MLLVQIMGGLVLGCRCILLDKCYMLENNTFSVGMNSDFNATVGNNGSGVPMGEARSNIDYAIGFSSAALELIEVALTSQKLENCVDYLVYPICFNMRHAVELQLKKVWKDLSILAEYRKVRLTEHKNGKIKASPFLRGKIKPFPDLDEASTHDLRIIWNLVEEYAPLIDTRFVKLIGLLTPFINDIAEMDSTGQTFRYPASNESQVHLDDTPIINIEILKVRFANLVEVLKLLEKVSKEMIYEYSWSEITNSLSHFDIIQATYHAANFLGDETPYYKGAKVSTLKEFNISSNEYSQLIKISAKDKTINHILNIDNQPKHLDLKSLVTFFDILDKVYPMTDYVEKYTRSSYSIFDFRTAFGVEAIKKMHEKRQAIEEISKKLTLHQIAEIYSLYDFHKQPCYIGIFESELKRNIDELEVYQARSHTAEIHDFIKYFLEKTNLINGVLTSMWTLNMKPLVKELIENYNLASVPWYDKLIRGEVRNGLTEYHWFESKIAMLQKLTEKSNQSIELLRLLD
ncbi:transcriptional regulator [Shewanella livingstonensis]|uniref:Transcriptional regulator n=1 Tax=Shewanella livingstonensis TaxID=150120 RepID=A0A3G8LSG9_9GAMM|nr:transcriptional regulator [Shewanella livingstonensis]AZG72394.1 transcriptional regulator [Shewanella livingstonensis]